MSQPTINSRWSTFRALEDCIPSNLYEAGVFLQNARLHLLAYGFSSMDARLIINDAHDEVNKCFSREVAA